MAWHLAQSLFTLRAEVNRLYPNRSKVSDGTIGDTAHASRASRHNPNKSGVVTAMDITHDPGRFDAHIFADKLRLEQIKGRGHPELAYLVSNRRIASPTNNWAWRTYNGSNPHDHHIHVAVGQGSDADPRPPYDSTQTWLTWDQGTNPDPGPQPPPVEVQERFACDVSQYQGQVDWKGCWDEGARTAIMRASVGLKVDTGFARNWQASRAAGFQRRLGYHYLKHGNVEAQAALFLGTVGPLGPGDGLMIDVEDSDIEDAEILTFISICEAATGRSLLHYQGDMVGDLAKMQHRAQLTPNPLVWPAYGTTEAKMRTKCPRPPTAWQQKPSGKFDSNLVFDLPALNRVCGLDEPTPIPEPKTIKHDEDEMYFRVENDPDVAYKMMPDGGWRHATGPEVFKVAGFPNIDAVPLLTVDEVAAMEQAYREYVAAP